MINFYFILFFLQIFILIFIKSNHWYLYNFRKLLLLRCSWFYIYTTQRKHYLNKHKQNDGIYSTYGVVDEKGVGYDVGLTWLPCMTWNTLVRVDKTHLYKELVRVKENWPMTHTQRINGLIQHTMFLASMPTFLDFFSPRDLLRELKNTTEYMNHMQIFQSSSWRHQV